MLEKPKNYEEAKKIIENAPNDDMQAKKMKTVKLRALAAVGVGVAAAISAGVMTEDPSMGAIVLGNSMFFAAPFTLPYFFRQRTKRELRNGTYFDDKSEEEVMKLADEYVDEYNEFDDSKGRSR